MGMTTDAYLYFGVDVIDPDKDNSEFRKKACELIGGTLNEDGECVNCGEASEKLSDGDLMDHAVSVLKKRYPGLNISCDRHCSDSYPVWFFCLHKEYALRGYPEDISFSKLEDMISLQKKAFAIALGQAFDIPEEDIGWKLASYYSH